MRRCGRSRPISSASRRGSLRRRAPTVPSSAPPGGRGAASRWPRSSPSPCSSWRWPFPSPRRRTARSSSTATARRTRRGARATTRAPRSATCSGRSGSRTGAGCRISRSAAGDWSRPGRRSPGISRAGSRMRTPSCGSSRSTGPTSTSCARGARSRKGCRSRPGSRPFSGARPRSCASVWRASSCATPRRRRAPGPSSRCSSPGSRGGTRGAIRRPLTPGTT